MAQGNHSTEVDKKRKEHLDRCRSIAETFTVNGRLAGLESVFRDRGFSENFFRLFAETSQNILGP